MNEIQVVFDRPDRLSRFGGKVKGRVVIKGDSNFECTEVGIRDSWRTSGRGDRDKGPQRSPTLRTDGISVQAGERKEFPFRFHAPEGPVTYHGHKLNVDWQSPATFSSNRNDLKWFVELCVNFRGWAGLTKRSPLMVLPDVPNGSNHDETRSVV